MFDGTVAENISRFSEDAKDEDIVDAAKRTGAHRHGAFAQCDTVYVMENGRPVPATGGEGGRSAPVRQLQEGGARKAESGEGRPAAARQRSPARRDARGGGQAQQQPARPAPPAPPRQRAQARPAPAQQERVRARPPAPAERGRDEQIAGAIARVRGAIQPPKPKEASAAQAALLPQERADVRPPARDGRKTPAPAGEGQVSEVRRRRDELIAGAVARVSGSAPPSGAGENESTQAPDAPPKGSETPMNQGDAT